jgi:hypothetical protein
MNQQLKDKAYLIFNRVDNTSTDFAVELAALGVDRVVGRALALEWASEKYHTPIINGQRGATLKRDSAAHKAWQRVVSFIWPNESGKRGGKRNSADPVEALLKRFEKLTAAQRRRFKAAI